MEPTTSSTGLPPLHAATKEGKHDLVQELLTAGADVDATFKGMTPLHHAAEAGQDSVLQILLAAGADVDAVMRDGSTALHMTAENGRLGMVQQLLTAGAAVDGAIEQQRTPMTAAAGKGHTDVVRVLLAAGATVNVAVVDFGHSSPLAAAVSSGFLEVMQLLLRSGADPRIWSRGSTCLHLAAMCGRAAAVQLLLDNWGQPAVTAVDLVKAAQMSMFMKVYVDMETFSILARELHKRYAAELQQLFQGCYQVDASDAVWAVVEAWAEDVSSIGEQQAALCKREEGVVKQQQALQQLVVSIAGMAKRGTKQAPALGHC